VTRGPLLGSTFVHLGVLIALFMVRGAPPMVVPGPDVVQVALVEPSGPRTWTPPPPAPEPEQTRTEVIKPEEDEGVRITPPPEKKKPPPPAERPRETKPAAAPALPYAPIGNAGLQGQISLDASDFEFTYYLLLVRNRIAQNWAPPGGTSAGQLVRTVVYFRISRGGEISQTRVESSSGVDFFDHSAQRAVLISDPLPPLPLGYPGAGLGVHFGFQYAAP